MIKFSSNSPPPSKTAIQCPQPLIPLNGKIDGTSGAFGQSRRYAVGALLTFSCNEGHLLVGEGSIVCTETGFWSHAPPICKYLHIHSDFIKLFPIELPIKFFVLTQDETVQVTNHSLINIGYGLKPVSNQKFSSKPVSSRKFGLKLVKSIKLTSNRFQGD